MAAPEPFKVCSCGTVWHTRDALVGDPVVVIIGYTPDFNTLELGWLFFNHQTCRTTFALPVMHRDNLRPCPAECECAWIRDMIGMLRNHKAGV